MAKMPEWGVCLRLSKIVKEGIAMSRESSQPSGARDAAVENAQRDFFVAQQKVMEQVMKRSLTVTALSELDKAGDVYNRVATTDDEATTKKAS